MTALQLDVVHDGDCRAVLSGLPEDSVDCVVTSPPYLGLRRYGDFPGEIGSEGSVQEHLDALVAVFCEVRRVLKPEGTVWCNYGDRYVDSGGAGPDGGQLKTRSVAAARAVRHKIESELKPKDLMGLPWRLAFALQSDGWWLRSDIVWEKPNPIPESVKDRPTRSHEYVFLLAASRSYYYDAAAIAEDCVDGSVSRREFRGGGTYTYDGTLDNAHARPNRVKGNEPTWPGIGGKTAAVHEEVRGRSGQVGRFAAHPTRNKRDVWRIATQATDVEHFATFPEELVEPCIRAGCPPGGVVLDPFMGIGTTGLVAKRLGRRFIGVELNPEYAQMARTRISHPSKMRRLKAAQGQPRLNVAQPSKERGV